MGLSAIMTKSLKKNILEVRHRDRTKERPIAYLLLEIKEKYEYLDDLSVMNAQVEVSYERLYPEAPREHKKGQFNGSYRKDYNIVSLTSLEPHSQGAIFLDLPGLEGQRISTYLLNCIVKWVKQWPEAIVNTIELLRGQAYPENKKRRNRLYEQFNIVFDYHDNNMMAGESFPMLAESLTPVDTWKENITEHNTSNFLSEMLLEKEKLSIELKFTQRQNKQLTTEHLKALSSPLPWAIRTLFQKQSW